ncbi:MAG: hypothetical protein A2X13_06720 [Bacteroidetes bacterium GWC2_33_15]|nr:MAG: hypothetical protein A2X10_02150 [Bacteroidetes bacterium GWA2_33_15]OFX52476.1 MAG: hypothetical protein A2X13_06720 [Bacteroidetes bacterium GWC2_33_15]OFX65537.1 MAG: hypothetical protein A2X15_14835 [Bacteroidetes bacterium GWB2_32_14]OFX67558.1 MAG: hypothetical protein A2X14_11555 [Bacteroidetes bacterium GWD2_33_33]HAN18399.1 hypothetical protein [Bacteroidales bacterium]
MCLFNNAFSQDDVVLTGQARQDINQPQVHSPHKATMYSALIPGLGQVYNKKYWKLPVIYGLTGIFIYSFDYNNTQYNKFKNAYADFQSGKITSFEGYTDKAIILKIKDNYSRNRDLNVISLAAIYLLNVVDAAVDAHLFYYDISEDLSLDVQPAMQFSVDKQSTYGFALSISF